MRLVYLQVSDSGLRKGALGYLHNPLTKDLDLRPTLLIRAFFRDKPVRTVPVRFQTATCTCTVPLTEALDLLAPVNSDACDLDLDLQSADLRSLVTATNTRLVHRPQEPQLLRLRLQSFTYRTHLS